MISVEIDPASGFCAGVIRAIGRAEDFLDAGGGTLFSLGAIVHNEAELERLSAKGLVTLENDGTGALPPLSEGDAVLVRAHGQSPSAYANLGKAGARVIDCTCPVVLALQKMIKNAEGQVVIFGKIGHAEVLGLVGQVNGNAVVVENAGQLSEAISSGRIDVGGEIDIFSQTTMSPTAYEAACGILAKETGRRGGVLRVHDTICSQVASRHRKLKEFAASHSVIVFVSGTSSSNGKVLCELCRSVNPRTYHIGGEDGIDPAWFRNGDTVGVCGATSTPGWLLEKVAQRIENLQ